MVDIPGNSTTSTFLTVGGPSVIAAIEVPFDTDWIRVNLVAGKAYQFYTGREPIGTISDTILTLRDASGNVLTYNDDHGEGNYSRIGLVAETTGTYYLEVAGFQNNIGNYNLTAIEVPVPPVFTNDQIAAQLTTDYWFANSESPGRFNVASGGTLTVNIANLTTQGQFFARAALQVWHDATGINFLETSSASASISFDDTDVDNAYASSYSINGFTTSATINIGTNWIAGDGTNLNSYSYQTYIHEIGHTLGLGHAGNYNGSAQYDVDNLYRNDSWQATVMSYFSQSENTFLDNSFAYIMTPMMADLIAIQNLYGSVATTRTGNTVYGFNSTAGNSIFNASLFPAVSYVVFDNGGVDTLDYSGFSQSQNINLNAETFSNVGGLVGNVGIARGVKIENAIGGGGADTLTGNAAANTLNGGSGVDTMIGGDGIDVYYADVFNDVISETNTVLATGGNDLVYFAGTTGTLTLGANVERLTLTGSAAINGTGNALANTLTGNSASNTLTGLAGKDVINGGAGVDTMIGGDGIDVYYADVFNDVISETNTVLATGGNDLVYFAGTTGTLTLGANVERLTLSGSAAINGTGNELANTLTGNSASNTLSGGLGKDNLTGGLGSDKFVFNTALNAATNVDTIKDFVHLVDDLLLSMTIFSAIGTILEASEFAFGTVAADDNDFIIFNQTNGQLFYDANGSLAGGQTLFARVTAGIDLDVSDFMMG